MKPERWKQVDELLDAALELSSDEREKFLNESCHGDDELRREVLSLLAAHEKADGFMSAPAIEVAAKHIAQENTLVEIIGREFGEYKIERLLGTGGMGEVYLAYDSKLRRKVALKILPSQFMRDEERIKRFEREARAVSSLNHPNLITIYDIGNSNGTHFIATEYVEGKTVRELIDKKISMKDALAVAMQVAESLSAAHNEKIVHRDIKPENIMVRPDGYVKVLDFGLAKLIEPTGEEIHISFSQTQPGVVMGTLTYMSPEQATGDSIDHRTDIWSLGVVLYEMMTGIAPFKGANRQETLNAILYKEPQSVTDSNPSLHLELDRIIGKALEKDKDYRYQTASDFRADLKRLKRELDSSPSVSANTSGRTKTRKQQAESTSSISTQRPFWHYVWAAMVVVVFGIGFWFLLSRFSKPNVVVGPDWSKAKNIQLTNHPEGENHSYLSPDGKAFVFTSRASGNLDIYWQRVGGSSPKNITEDSKQDDTTPAFSPDGNFIAFHSDREPRGLYIMGATGENPRRVTDFGYNPAWSPDGKEIVSSEEWIGVHTNKSARETPLTVVNVSTREKRILTNNGVQPSWSPNGYRVAYWRLSKEGRGDIFTIPSEGGEPVAVTSEPFVEWNPIWSPDGKFIYYGSNRGGQMNIWRIAVNEKTGEVLGTPEAVSTPSRYSRNLSFSRDGKLLAYVRYESQSNARAIPLDASLEKAAGEPVWITRGVREISTPALSPDGEYYVARYPDYMQEDLAIFNKDGSNLRFLTEDVFRDRRPRWSPDGKKIAFDTDRTGKPQIWLINPEGGGVQQITFEEEGASLPVWSNDGKRILYQCVKNKKPQNCIIDMTKNWQEQTPEVLPAINFGGYLSIRDWSPDGKKLIGALGGEDEGSGGIVIYSMETKSYEKITDFGYYPSWFNDNHRFVFYSFNKIHIGDILTKKTHLFFTPPAYSIQHPAISPDNKFIYFRYLEIEADVWLLSLE